MPVEVIKRNLDGLAEAKMNVLHWHLSENQGFRVESKKHPKLQELGSDGKFYTQEQIKEIVAYARDRGIRIIPEFDMPGHSTSWMVGYPELAGAPGPYQLARKYDGSGPSPAFDPTREEIYEFIDSFVGEMTELFPDEYFHIGGDEVSGKQWNGNPEIQAFMYQHNMKTNEDLQAYFNSRLLKILTKHHRKMVGWDEILQPGLPKTIVVHSWRGADSLVESAKKGYDTILSNGYYLDNIRSAAFHYNVDPLPAKGDLTSEQKSHILGGEACMWSEFVTPETIDSRIWPRVLAVAERLWSPASVKDVDNFYDRMEVESGRLGELGLTHLSNYIPMLKSLVGNQPVEPLKVLADVVEPLKLYERPEGMAYSTETPLNHLVDAVRPESLTARAFRISVDSYLKEPPRFGDFEGLQELLRIWKDNHKSLEPILIKAHLSPVAAQSRDLSIIAQLGLEALRFLKAGKPAPAAWQEKASQALTRAQQPQAEVEIAVISPIRKLTLAAGQLDKLKGSTGEKWNKSLDDQVKTAKRESWE
jgi:hexosaminidase